MPKPMPAKPMRMIYKDKQNSFLKYDDISRKLILHLFGFKENDENFEKVFLYIQSNLLHHNNLEVDCHSVQDSLQGIAFKMGVHGYQSKSEHFLSLTKKFILLLDKHEEVNLKWSLLSLLMNLGKHPARDDLPSNAENPICHTQLEATPAPSDNDWLKQLTANSIHQQDNDETLSIWSEDDEIKNSNSHGVNFDDFSKHSGIIDDNDLQEQPDSLLLRNSHLARSWVVNNMLPQYWDQTKRSQMLTEYVIMRECLWVLISPSESWVFAKDKTNEFFVQPSCLCHLSKETLKKLLEPVAFCATRLNAINLWLGEVANTPQIPPPGYGTLKSFAEGLKQWKHNFLSFLCNLEKLIISQEGHQTLLWLLTELNPFFMDLNTIYEMHYKIINSSPEEDACSKAFNLLGTLVLSVDIPRTQMTKNTLLSLLRFSLRFHLISLQNLLFSSNCIELNHSQMCLVEFGIESITCDKNKLDFVVDQESPITRTRGLSFLKAIQHQVAKAYRLKYILERLDKLEGQDIDIESIVSEALKNFYLRSRYDDSISIDQSPATKETNASEDNRAVPSTVNYPDSFLRRAFELSDCNDCSHISQDLKPIDVSTDIGLENLLVETLYPIVTRRCQQLGVTLFRVLKDHYQLRSQMEIFRRVAVMEAGDIMHSFYTYLFSLIDEKEPIHEYMLTSQMQDCVSASCPDLASHFSVSFSESKDDPDHSKRISSLQSCEKLLTTIAIDYQTEFPLSLIINEAVIFKYNQLFRFGLFLKRMLCAMKSLHFKDFTRFVEPSLQVTFDEGTKVEAESCLLPQRIHRLQLLRHWLLHFVRLIHDHFYLTVFMPFSLRFEAMFQKCTNFFQLINEQEILIDEVCHQCLLTPQATFSNILWQIYSVVEEMKCLWQGPVDEITSIKLADLEDRYATGHRVTARYLSTLKQFPHLSSLVEGLNNNIPT